MKYIKLLLVLVLVPLLNLKGQNESLNWNYPLRPGIKEWENLATYEEKLKSYNIPESIIKKMSTSILIETCLNYPEIRLIMTRNSLQEGYNYISSIFNGFAELESRLDAGKNLIQVYVSNNPQKIGSFKTNLEKGSYSFNLVYIELILSQPNVLSNLVKEDQIKLIQLSSSYYKNKDLLNNDYSLFSLSATTLVLGRLLDVKQDVDFILSKHKNFRLQNFIELTSPIDKEIMDQIVILATEYLNKLTHE